MAEFDPDAYLKENEVDDSGFDPDAYLAENEQYIDPVSAAIDSFTQGAYGGYVDEIAGLVEGGYSILPWRDDKRSFSQAREEGAQNKLKQLRAAREQYPYLAPTAELLGGITSGYALTPFAGASKLRQLATTLGLGAASGAGYAEGGLENRLKGALKGTAIAAALPTAGAALNLTGKAIRSGASTISGIPKQWMGRYFERGRDMNKADTLKNIGQEVFDDRAAMRTLAGTKSKEARKILSTENVKLGQQEMVDIIKDQLAKADRNNTSSKPVIAKLESYLRELEGTPATHEIVNIPGVQSQTVPTSTRTVVTTPVNKSTTYTPGTQEIIDIPGTQTQTIPSQSRTVVGPANIPPVPVQGRGYGMPIQNARGVQGGIYEAEPMVVDVFGARQSVVPTNTRSVITTPGVRSSSQTPGRIEDIQIPGVTQIQVPTSTRSVITRREKGINPTGEYAKNAVTNFDELAGWVKEQGLTGNQLAKDTRKAIQDALKGKSKNYENKMNEIDALMGLLKESKKGFSTPQSSLSKLRQIGEGRESGAFAADTLDKLGKQAGKNYRSRIDDQMTLEAFNPKESLKPTSGSRAVPRTMYDAGKDIVEAASRPIVKKTIETGAFFNRIIQKVPAPARKMLLEAKRAGGNAVSLTHGMLMRTDPEYAAIIEQEQQ
jgi:hypothetical protein